MILFGALLCVNKRLVVLVSVHREYKFTCTVDELAPLLPLCHFKQFFPLLFGSVFCFLVATPLFRCFSACLLRRVRCCRAVVSLLRVLAGSFLLLPAAVLPLRWCVFLTLFGRFGNRCCRSWILEVVAAVPGIFRSWKLGIFCWSGCVGKGFRPSRLS